MRKLAAAALMLFSAGALAQALPPGMKMHRAEAGKLDASGWVTASSTEGNFSVRLPCKYNDFTMNGYNPTEPVEKGYAVGCMDGKRKYSATRIHYRNGAKDAKAYFERAEGVGKMPGAVATRTTFGKLPAVDVATEGSGRCGYLRFIQLGTDNLVMAIEAPVEACNGLDAQAAKYFKSLSLKN